MVNIKLGFMDWLLYDVVILIRVMENSIQKSNKSPF